MEIISATMEDASVNAVLPNFNLIVDVEMLIVFKIINVNGMEIVQAEKVALTTYALTNQFIQFLMK